SCRCFFKETAGAGACTFRHVLAFLKRRYNRFLFDISLELATPSQFAVFDSQRFCAACLRYGIESQLKSLRLSLSSRHPDSYVVSGDDVHRWSLGPAWSNDRSPTQAEPSGI